jgi:uncharacterized membrane protein
MTKGEIAGLVILALSVALAAVFYPRMPAQMADHWNAAGEVNGYMPRLVSLLISPAIIALTWLVFFAIPRIDPLKKNILQFRAIYDWLIVVVLLFILGIGVQVILWNLQVRVSPNQTLPVAFGLLCIFMGQLLGRAKRNYFVGIRTPWTLASDVVWEKTHRLGRWLFTVAGVVSLLGVFFGRYALPFILVPALASAAVLVLYSYLVYSRLPEN